jgi:hypothetical protein
MMEVTGTALDGCGAHWPLGELMSFVNGLCPYSALQKREIRINVIFARIGAEYGLL